MEKVEYTCPLCKKTKVVAEFIERKEEIARLHSNVGCPECLYKKHEEAYATFTCQKCGKVYGLVVKEVMWILEENGCCFECIDKKMKSLGQNSNLYETALKSGAIDITGGETEREQFLIDMFSNILYVMYEKDGMDFGDGGREYLEKNRDRFNFVVQEMQKKGEISKEEQEKLFYMYEEHIMSTLPSE